MMPESAITMSESAITMPGIADHHAGTSDHDGLELAITFDWNARSQWAGLRTCERLLCNGVGLGGGRPVASPAGNDRPLASRRLRSRRFPPVSLSAPESSPTFF